MRGCEEMYKLNEANLYESPEHAVHQEYSDPALEWKITFRVFI